MEKDTMLVIISTSLLSPLTSLKVMAIEEMMKGWRTGTRQQRHISVMLIWTMTHALDQHHKIDKPSSIIDMTDRRGLTKTGHVGMCMEVLMTVAT